MHICTESKLHCARFGPVELFYTWTSCSVPYWLLLLLHLLHGVLVMEESALLEDGGECITISGTMLSCPGEYTGFGCCCCWTSGDSLAMGCSWVAHLSDNHFLIKTMMTAIVVVIAHIKKATIIRKKVLYNLL